MEKNHATRIWEAGHKTVTLFQGASKTPLPTTLRMSVDGIQTHHARVPKVKGMPESARKIIQAYLDMVDWRHIQTGGHQGSTKDWSTSPSFAQWQGYQMTKVILSPEARDLVRKSYGRRNNSSRGIHRHPQGFRRYGTNSALSFKVNRDGYRETRLETGASPLCEPRDAITAHAPF